jgi:putative tryptophan/tyrosine transport system substrate-binding protein
MVNFSRRRFVAGVSLASAGLSTGIAAPAFGQAADGKTFRIAILTPRENIGDVAGFRDFFANARVKIEYDLRVVTNMPDMPGHVEALKQSRPDLIFTVFTPITQAVLGAHDAVDKSKFITDIPVVFSSVTNPVASKVVSSLEAPGRNCTGTRHIAPLDTQVRTINLMRPLNKLAIIYNAAESNMVVTADELRTLQQPLGFQMLDKPVPQDAEDKPIVSAIPDLVRAAAAEGADFIYIGPDTLVGSNNSKSVADTAMELKIPTFCATELPVRQSNMLMGLVSRAYNVGRFAGYKASEILIGGKSAQAVPVETLKRFSFIIRIPVAQKLNLYPPMRLLNIAEVITS